MPHRGHSPKVSQADGLPCSKPVVSQCWRWRGEPGGPQRVREVLFAELSPDVARVLPDAGKAVGLQLEAHGAGVLACRVLLIGRRDALQDAEQHLDMMRDLMGHHVS